MYIWKLNGRWDITSISRNLSLILFSFRIVQFHIYSHRYVRTYMVHISIGKPSVCYLLNTQFSCSSGFPLKWTTLWMKIHQHFFRMDTRIGDQGARILQWTTNLRTCLEWMNSIGTQHSRIKDILKNVQFWLCDLNLSI